jgi:formyl-CoA transferase
MWTNLCNAIGRPEMATDERFKDRRARLHHVEELTAAISAWTTKHTKHDVMRILGEADVPCGKVLDSVELLDDPHLRERGMIVTVQHPVRGEFTMPGCPVKLEDSPVEVTSAPLLGEHNNEVFAKYLGFDATEVERLKQEGVI